MTDVSALIGSSGGDTEEPARSGRPQRLQTGVRPGGPGGTDTAETDQAGWWWYFGLRTGRRF